MNNSTQETQIRSREQKIAMVAITLHGTELLKKLASDFEQADIFIPEKLILLPSKSIYDPSGISNLSIIGDP